MKCPLCKRAIINDKVNLTHREVSEGVILCGYTSRTFGVVDALEASPAKEAIQRLWEALDHHLTQEDVEVEIRTKDGWVYVRDLIRSAIR